MIATGTRSRLARAIVLLLLSLATLLMVKVLGRVLAVEQPYAGLAEADLQIFPQLHLQVKLQHPDVFEVLP